MANIKTHLSNIKNALFGNEVRGSIHDGIYAINKEVENTTGRQVDLESTFDQLVINAGNSNAEIVDARVKSDGTSYSKLGDRLNEVDSQLEHNMIIVRDRLASETNDNNAIQEAIYNAKDGTIVKLTKDFYEAENIILKSNITIEGNGKTVVKLLNNSNCSIFTNSEKDNYGTDKNITLKNLSLDGNYNYQSLKHESNSPLYFKGVDGLKIINVKVNNGYYANIFTNNCKKVVINECVTYNSYIHGGIVVSGDTYYDYAEINKCICYDNNLDGILAVQPVINVTNCICYNNGVCRFLDDLPACGIFLDDKNIRGEISNNEIYNNSGFGIELRNSNNIVIRNNKCYKNGLSGIICHGNTNNNVIENNECYNNSVKSANDSNYGGIFVGGFDSDISKRTNNIIKNNKCWSDNETQLYGVVCINADNNIIVDNITINNIKSNYLINENENSIIKGTEANYSKIKNTPMVKLSNTGTIVNIDAESRLEFRSNQQYLDFLKNDNTHMTLNFSIPMGTTAQRPRGTNGMLYLDQTIGKVIVCYGGENRWVDVTDINNVL